MWISPVQRLASCASLGWSHRGVAVMEADLIYYRRRAAEERGAAESAPDSFVRAVHLELARRYDERISTLGTKADRPDLRLVLSA